MMRRCLKSCAFKRARVSMSSSWIMKKRESACLCSDGLEPVHEGVVRFDGELESKHHQGFQSPHSLVACVRYYASRWPMKSSGFSEALGTLWNTFAMPRALATMALAFFCSAAILEA